MTEQVEYTMYPPVAELASTESMADNSNCFCKCGIWMKSFSVLEVLTDSSLAMTPVPEHGASNKTLSNPPMTFGNSLAS
ncbi:hypothetical protein WICPIJ_004723 [Wickerhamomyces pijperi]|uniref:Uncharacterized protein n=1 Tax=Wickerhamomyces pijperi TaxID=599730 RepID=A0A9P8TMM1_WICPI|nr:hypothetical protein WICPIJ_004723 [Wickerhamomyces pijperi]